MVCRFPGSKKLIDVEDENMRLFNLNQRALEYLKDLKTQNQGLDMEVHRLRRANSGLKLENDKLRRALVHFKVITVILSTFFTSIYLYNLLF